MEKIVAEFKIPYFQFLDKEAQVQGELPSFAKDNDYLTFRVAKSNDLWLHAADYPGSHVVVKSKNKLEIPNKTLIEAAQLAAFYSQAREESKVAVHYTLRKFVHKPKGAVAGLVNLASFKTILVEPKIENENR